jgi:hypothetical protein
VRASIAARIRRSLRRGPRAAARPALGLAVLALAGCQWAPEAPAPAALQAARPAVVSLGPPAAAPARLPPERELCPVLASVLAAEPAGFARLRATRVAGDRWLGRESLPGIGRCTIEGEAWPRARYACASEPFRSDNRDGAHARFTALAEDIDRCLSKPIWFPRAWRKGEPFEFAMGERLQTWTDQSSAPPSQVVLKVQQDIDHGGYLLQLALEAIR